MSAKKPTAASLTDAMRRALAGYPVDETLMGQVRPPHAIEADPPIRLRNSPGSRPQLAPTFSIGELSDDLRRALAVHPVAEAVLERLPPSHVQEYVTWIDDAKKPETRARRIAGMIERLLGKKA
jgi:hypothetical protein